MSDLRLVIWDVDGTLANSRASVATCMQQAFAAVGMTYPGDARALEGVGLSLAVLFERLVPEASEDQIAALSQAYRDGYYQTRRTMGQGAMSPLFDGIRPVLDALDAQATTLQAVATGKSKRGLDAFVSSHQLNGYFFSQQVADFHPSKPHPSMIETALHETGIEPERAVMIGDTTFDMEMGRAAHVNTIAVSWGYHPIDRLDADRVVNAPDKLLQTIEELLA